MDSEINKLFYLFDKVGIYFELFIDLWLFFYIFAHSKNDIRYRIMKKTTLLLISLYMGLMGVIAQNNKDNSNKDGDVNITDVIQMAKNNKSQYEGKKVTGEAIDLGLPSGMKWASCNIGANKPEEYGDYFAWGETEKKKEYNWSSYIHSEGRGSEIVCYDFGSDISGKEYDVAHVKWGGKWHMPTSDDIQELLDNCKSEWTKLNGVVGRKFTSKINGKSIFFPAAGYRWNGTLSHVGKGGFYWSSTQSPYHSYYAYYLYFRKGRAYWYLDYRYYGRSVRPVMK